MKCRFIKRYTNSNLGLIIEEHMISQILRIYCLSCKQKNRVSTIIKIQIDVCHEKTKHRDHDQP